jgi:hypothetical protein
MPDPTRSPWEWNPKSQRYYNTTSGQFLSNAKMLDLRDQFTAAKQGSIRALAGDVASGKISVQEWTLGFRQQVKTTYLDEYILARGGRNNMTQADWGRVGQMVKTQYQYQAQFAADVAAGKLTEPQIAARSSMYINSATQAYEKGRVAGRGMPSLPQYPGDGNTVCHANCKCNWDIEETDTEWLATWSLGAAEHCDDCVDLAGRYNPLRMQK